MLSSIIHLSFFFFFLGFSRLFFLLPVWGNKRWIGLRDRSHWQGVLKAAYLHVLTSFTGSLLISTSLRVTQRAPKPRSNSSSRCFCIALIAWIARSALPLSIRCSQSREDAPGYSPLRRSWGGPVA